MRARGMAATPAFRVSWRKLSASDLYSIHHGVIPISCVLIRVTSFAVVVMAGGYGACVRACPVLIGTGEWRGGLRSWWPV